MKKIIACALAFAMVLSFSACGSENAPAEETTSSIIQEIPKVSINEDPITVDPIESETEEEKAQDEPEVIPPNSYRSELTNEWISNDIKDQRPLAIMVDNEKTALDHYGTSEADIVYELQNSTLNGRVTRLMCIFKDWQNLERVGSIRSTRPTNCYLAPEYNAILIHDGGPYYINDWLAKPAAKDHLSGGFARFDNGKNWEYREYLTTEDYTSDGKTYDSVQDRIAAAGFDTEYNEYYMGEHFKFADEEFSLENAADAKKAVKVELPYDHNSTMLTYDEDTKTYVYSEYGQEYVDALHNCPLQFKNVIIQCANIFVYDEHGYLIYNTIGHPEEEGYYLTNGYAIPIQWQKASEQDVTRFYNKETGEELELNTGKIYITLCGDDVWNQLVIK